MVKQMEGQMITINKRIEMFHKMMGDHISKEFYEWLIENGFFTAPASTKYHGAYEGGLFDHSMAVAEALVQFTYDNWLKWSDERSPLIVGMFHDLCKIDKYEKIIDVEGVQFMGLDEPKDEESHFEYNNQTFIPGHADKSVMMLAQHMQLTEEEILCIRYHMGSYETKEWNFYDRAIKKYENVLWTHHADMYASKVKGV